MSDKALIQIQASIKQVMACVIHVWPPLSVTLTSDPVLPNYFVIWRRRDLQSPTSLWKTTFSFNFRFSSFLYFRLARVVGILLGLWEWSGWACEVSVSWVCAQDGECGVEAVGVTDSATNYQLISKKVSPFPVRSFSARQKRTVEIIAHNALWHTLQTPNCQES